MASGTISPTVTCTDPWCTAEQSWDASYRRPDGIQDAETDRSYCYECGSELASEER